jgi:YD repeat-containing protein
MNTHTPSRLIEILCKICLQTLVVFLLALTVTAQTSATDGHTPSGLARGTAGSFALSGFDNVNPYNGGLNFRLPLLQVGGRGTASYNMQLPIEQKWRVNYFSDFNPQTGQTTEFLDPEPGWWTGAPAYSPGALVGRKAGYDSVQCYATQQLIYGSALTRLSFVTPDGTELQLIDKLREGKPMDVPCYASQGYSRGTVFVTTDGTSATFISDATIYDPAWTGEHIIYPSGVLIMRDGTRYRIDNSLVMSITDRQGNRLTFNYGYGPRLETITDSLGRQITIEYDVTEAPYGLCDRITFQAFENASRKIRVSRKTLGNVLRSGFALRTFHDLFPELNNASTTDNYDPLVTSEVWLPDARSYSFRYNSYGELARVNLPTGGAFEYDWAAGAENSNASGVIGGGQDTHIYRRLVSRRVYADGINLESNIVISRPESSAGNGLYDNLGYVWAHETDSIGNPLGISKHYFYGSPIQSLFDSNPVSYSSWKEGREYKTEMYAADGTTPLRRIENVLGQCDPCEMNMNWASSQSADTRPANNPQVVTTTTTLLDGGANQVTKTTFKYDKYNNLIDTWDYNFGQGAAPAYPVRRTHTDYLTSNNGQDYTGTDIHIRNLPTNNWVKAVDPASGTAATYSTAKTELIYDESNYPLIEYGAVTGWGSPSTNPSIAASRGNVTTLKKWKDVTNDLYIVSHAQHDQLGNLRKSWDGCGALSEIEYASTYHYGFPTKTISPSIPNPADPLNSTIALETNMQYDLPSGLLISTTDANNQTTYVEYNDILNRPTKVTMPTGGGLITYTYGDGVGNLYVRTRQSLDASRNLEAYQHFDGLGRKWRSSRSEGETSILVDTQYDALGRVSRVSNPYRVGETVLWTMTTYDLLGRGVALQTPDNALSTATYGGNQTTVTDQAGKQRKSVSNALGWLTSVFEAPNTSGYNFETRYLYDVLGNLIKVTQGPQDTTNDQVRTFAYDSLSWLTSATNPENGTVSYSYDNNGNLLMKTDARTTATNYVYDAMNRVTERSYSGGTAVATPP